MNDFKTSNTETCSGEEMDENIDVIEAIYCNTPEKIVETLEAEIAFLKALREEYDGDKRNYQFNIDCSIYLLEMLLTKLRIENMEYRPFYEIHPYLPLGISIFALFMSIAAWVVKLSV